MRRIFLIPFLVIALVYLLPASLVFAAVPTVEASNAVVAGIDATLNGEITATGNGNNDYRGFVWGYTSHGDPGNTAPAATAYDYNWTESGSFGTGTFDHLVTLETALSVYYFRACAHSADGWAYSEELDFFTKEADKVYLEIRPHFDESIIRGRGGIPTEVNVGIYQMYSMPIWDAGGNIDEELYFRTCVPDRWDGESYILVHIVSVLANANEAGNSYQWQLEWKHSTPNEDAIPNTSNITTTTRTVTSNTQYFSYLDWFIIPYNADVGDDIEPDDNLVIRLRRIAAGGQLTDLNGELMIHRLDMLFARGDLLGDPTGEVALIIDDLIADGTLVGGEGVILIAMLLIPLGLMSIGLWRGKASALFGAAIAWTAFSLYVASLTEAELALSVQNVLVPLGAAMALASVFLALNTIGTFDKFKGGDNNDGKDTMANIRRQVKRRRTYKSPPPRQNFRLGK